MNPRAAIRDMIASPLSVKRTDWTPRENYGCGGYYRPLSLKDQAKLAMAGAEDRQVVIEKLVKKYFPKHR